jgi:cyclase
MLRKRLFTLTSLASTLVSAALILSAQGPGGDGKGKGKGGPPPLQPLTVSQLKPGLFLIVGDGGNTSVRVTKDGLIVTDTKNLGEANYAPMPVKYVFITHHHQDHSGNNGKFSEAGAKVIAHEGLIKNLETYNPAQGKPGKPNMSYAKVQKVKLGGVTVTGYHYMPAHTGGDTIVHFADLGVVQCGDVVVGIQPNIDFPFGGSGVHWLETLNSIDKLKWDTLIPGHSGMTSVTMTRAEFAEYKKKWETLIGRAVEQVKKGTTKEQLLASIKTDDIGWNINNQQWQQAARLDKFYDELKAEADKPSKK